MPLRSLVSSLVLSGLVAVPLLTTPKTAQAESLIDFLWGGGKEWGGERQTVSFDPKYTPGQIIVSFGDRRLYHITAKGQATSYPIAVPREQSRWQGATTVTSKRENPSWRPTPDMLKENPKLPSWVPGGHPMNPLGVRALYLGASLYRIHGTDAPWTIGQAVSKGCIRMFNKDVLDLYPRVTVGTRVTVTWERFTTQAVASSEGIPSSYDDVPLGQNLQPTFYGTSSRNVIRRMPPLPQSVRDAQTAAVRMEQPKPLTDDAPEKADDKPAKKTETSAKTEKAEKPAKEIKTAAHTTDTKPVIKPKADPAPHAARSQGTDAAIEAAQKAAAAAAKAAEAARKAADEAKRAAEDAKKATSTSSDPDKAAAKSAAL